MTIAYAGIGSRDITDTEAQLASNIARHLFHMNLLLYSGNATGADQAFQNGANGNCVLWLPWDNFGNASNAKALDRVVAGFSTEGTRWTRQAHPAPHRLTYAGRALINRDAHQVIGGHNYPQASFVVCIVTPRGTKGDVEGGTGQAVRVAKALGVPVINMREPYFVEELNVVLEKLGIGQFQERAQK